MSSLSSSANFLPMKVYIIGGRGIGEELDIAGISYLGGPADSEKSAKEDIIIDGNVGAVVVGFDPQINYYKLQYAQLCLNGNKNCHFIATNDDAVGHFTPNQEWAGAGSMVGAVKGCTNKTPVVVGKPNSVLLDYIVEVSGLSAKMMCMVGDRIDTDILFGKHNGMTTCLTLSGVTSRQALDAAGLPADCYPDYVVDSISDLRV